MRKCVTLERLIKLFLIHENENFSSHHWRLSLRVNCTGTQITGESEDWGKQMRV